MAAKNSKDWVQKAGIKKGAFTEKAKKRGLTAAQFQAKVLKDPTKFVILLKNNKEPNPLK